MILHLGRCSDYQGYKSGAESSDHNRYYYKKEYYEDVLYAVKKLLKFLNKNEQEWFDTEEYTVCSDGQDRRNKKYILWDEIYELAS